MPLPDPDTAANTMFDRVHSRVFFTKLAQQGIVPQTEKEASDLLEMAGRLREVAEQEKLASANHSQFGGPLQALNGVLGARGWNGHMKQASEQQFELMVKQASAEAANDPELYNATLSLISAEAAALAG